MKNAVQERMVIHPIRTEKDHASALQEIERLWDAKPNTVDADHRDILCTLVEAYESSNHPIDPPDPIEAIKFRMEQGELTRKELAKILGSQARVSEVLNHQRNLSLAMIRTLHKKLGISAEILIEVSKRPKSR